MPEPDPPTPPWSQLASTANDVARELLQTLPPELSVQAEALPLRLEPAPPPELVADGLDSDTLGLFVGPAFAEEPAASVPAHIVLFLNNLWDCAEGDWAVYKLEVRTTLLHELGHYLGLDEEDLADRGLE